MVAGVDDCFYWVEPPVPHRYKLCAISIKRCRTSFSHVVSQEQMFMWHVDRSYAILILDYSSPVLDPVELIPVTVYRPLTIVQCQSMNKAVSARVPPNE